MHSPISWVGGKLQLRERIYRRMPVTFEKYVEVFGGGGWVLFGMPNTEIRSFEVYNDKNKQLVNFFRCVRDRHMELLRELDCFPLASREEFGLLKRFLSKERIEPDYFERQVEVAWECLDEADAAEIVALLTELHDDTDVKFAGAFFKMICYSYASKGVSFGCRPYSLDHKLQVISAAHDRLQTVEIENRDFAHLIAHYDRPDTFFYLDPPYYETEHYYMDVGFTEADHGRLRAALEGVQGKWLLSYNDAPFIRNLYTGHYIESIERLNNMAQRFEGGKIYPEVLISNYDPMERERSLPRQISLY